MIRSWKRLHGLRTLPEIPVCEHSSLCHPQMQLKPRSCKEEAICKHDPQMLPTSLHLKWTEEEWKTVLRSEKSKFDFFKKHGCYILWTKEERKHPACYQHIVRKPATLMVWGCTGGYGIGSMHQCITAERYPEVLEQHMLPLRWGLFQGRPWIFPKPHTASITRAWLHSGRVQPLKWPVQTFYQL